MQPHEIERLSFEIIDAEAGDHDFPADQWPVVRRMIHTSADFDYIHSVRFSENAHTIGVEALKAGKNVVVDTNMVKSGIRRKLVEGFGGRVECLMTEPRVAEIAEERGTTRAKAAVDAALDVMDGGIYVVGNAPTALLRLLELMDQGKARPALVVGLPVGFVKAAESKELLCSSPYSYISNVGRKGGSNIAASVVNALIVLATGREAYE
ncbi:precorrin-8X methylmutase [Desulfopila sp. IMCC35008]|uniref:precorrin-8X methylmutase n=1 Tax=Desulfopila sp. IMCC35008 TaxID=2653858 RepID=UPI0013D469C3|nr:precorrin-8X methylmutase [Desulfopila sp. IMCC35008]